MPEKQKLLRITGGGQGAGRAEAVDGNACEIKTRAHAWTQRRARRVAGLLSALAHMRHTMKSPSDSHWSSSQDSPLNSTARIRNTWNDFKHVARLFLHIRGKGRDLWHGTRDQIERQTRLFRWPVLNGKTRAAMPWPCRCWTHYLRFHSSMSCAYSRYGKKKIFSILRYMQKWNGNTFWIYTLADVTYGATRPAQFKWKCHIIIENRKIENHQ